MNKLTVLTCYNTEIVHQQFLLSDHTIDRNWRKTLGRSVEAGPLVVWGNRGPLVDVEHVFEDQVHP